LENEEEKKIKNIELASQKLKKGFEKNKNLLISLIYNEIFF